MEDRGGRADAHDSTSQPPVEFVLVAHAVLDRESLDDCILSLAPTEEYGAGGVCGSEYGCVCINYSIVD